MYPSTSLLSSVVVVHVISKSSSTSTITGLPLKINNDLPIIEFASEIDLLPEEGSSILLSLIR